MSSARMNALLERAGSNYRVGYYGPVTPSDFVAMGEALMDRIEKLEQHTPAPRRFLVITGEYREYVDYLRNIHPEHKRRFSWIARMEHVQGMRGSELVLAGRFWLSPLWPRINEVRAYLEGTRPPVTLKEYTKREPWEGNL